MFYSTNLDVQDKEACSLYIKTIKRQRKDGSIKKNYYWAESYREGGKIKTRILGAATEQEALAYFKKRDTQKSVKTKETLRCRDCREANLTLMWTSEGEISVKCPKCKIERKYLSY